MSCKYQKPRIISSDWTPSWSGLWLTDGRILPLFHRFDFLTMECLWRKLNTFWRLPWYMILKAPNTFWGLPWFMVLETLNTFWRLPWCMSLKALNTFWGLPWFMILETLNTFWRLPWCMILKTLYILWRLLWYINLKRWILSGVCHDSSNWDAEYFLESVMMHDSENA